MKVASTSCGVSRRQARDHLLKLLAECDQPGTSITAWAGTEWLLLAWFAQGVLTLGDVAELGARFAHRAAPAAIRPQLQHVSYRVH